MATRTGTRAGALGLALGLALAAAAPVEDAWAETAWVRGEVRLNLRTGPSTGHRIVGGVKTGDRVEILERADDWTRVRAAGEVGWIPAGYLDAEPPASVRLEELQAEAVRLREQVETLRRENQELASRSESAVERETRQRAELERLAAENRQLKAGARWPHWITGASILAAGMLVGALLALTRPGRRSQRRIKL